MICSECGKDHPRDIIQLCFGRPDAVVVIRPDVRERTVRESDDLCIIGTDRFFIRAVLPLPVLGQEQAYSFGIWVELELAAFERVYELWNAPDQASEPPLPVALANRIPTLPDTLALRGELRLTGPTTRPEVYLAAGDHPLMVEQACGISSHRVMEYSSSVQW